MDLVANRYELLEVVGVGSACIVHRGRDRESGATVAVKVYRADGSVLDLLQQRREMAALARLRHPGLVTLLDGGTEPGPSGRTYVVTEFVDGCTLAARLVDGPLEPDDVRDLGVRLGHALVHVHAAGFVHRDVKPANVLLADGERPLLADFGIARAVDGTVATATGRVVGTAAYLSPEQIRGGEIAAPVDIYALGLILLECLTGRREYPGTSAESLVARLHRRPRVPAGLPWGLSAVVTAMTADDPAARPDAAAVASALAGAERETPVVPALSPSRRLSWAVAGTAAALLLGVPIVGGLSLGGGEDPGRPPAVGAGPGAAATPAPGSPLPVRPEQVEQVAAVAPAPAPAGGGAGKPSPAGGSGDDSPARGSGRGAGGGGSTAEGGDDGDVSSGSGNDGGNDGKAKGKGKGNGKGNNGNGKGNGGGKGKD